MDRDADLQQLRKRAENYLFEVLNNSPASARDTAHGITHLAFQPNNPVQQFFLAAATKTNETVSPPPETAKPRTTNKALSWLGRGRKDSVADKATSNTSSAAQLRLLGAGLPPRLTRPGENSPLGRNGQLQTLGSSAHQPGRSSDPTGRNSVSSAKNATEPSQEQQAANKAGASLPYSCILCQYDLSSKGVCKRHLEDQHVSPKTYECEKCRMPFDNKAEAKKHSGACGAGVFYFLAVRPEAKKMYACEFTGELFLSLKTYVDHLVRLSEKREDRPKGCMHRKLRALLERQDLGSRLHETSVSLLDSPDAWRQLVWPDTVVSKAIKQLEMATISSNESTINFPGDPGQREDRDIGLYLADLLKQSKLGSHHADRPQESLGMQQSERSSLSSHMVSNMSTPATTFSTVPTTPMSGVFTMPQLPGQPLSFVDPVETQSIDSNFHVPTAVDPMVGVVRQEQIPKRPLSGQSSRNMPHRQPPGPPLHTLGPSYNFTNPADTLFSRPQQHDAMEQNLSSASLPYRNLDVSSNASSSINFSNSSTSTINTQNTSILPDTGSDTTRAQSYREPELISQQMTTPQFDNATSTYWPQVSSDVASFASCAQSFQQPAPVSSSASGFQMIPSMFDFNGDDLCPPDQTSLTSDSIATTADAHLASMMDDPKMSYDLHPGVNGNMPFFMPEDTHPR